MLAVSDLNSSDCDYFCRPSGGCRVRYVGPKRGGQTMGACFPPDFGGSCIGTPPDCLDCNLVLDCQGGQQEEEEGEVSPNDFRVVEPEEQSCSAGSCKSKE